ncbi:GNAT family N-acetyltransferase [Spirosoma arcticum]
MVVIPVCSPSRSSFSGYGWLQRSTRRAGYSRNRISIYEPYRNQGLATEAANGLINRAFEHPDVNIVQAHTLAEENASVGVLKKCGMAFVQAIEDPDDGAIWQWQLPRS